MVRQPSAEDSLIARYFRRSQPIPGRSALADDAARSSKPSGDDIVVTTDAIVEGVHFLPDDPPDTIARKALAGQSVRSRGQGRRAPAGLC
jgi:thiamine-monophosphate kinase